MFLIKVALVSTLLYIVDAATNHFVEPILQQQNFLSTDGQYKYGYKSNVATHDEVRGIDGITRGYYSYIDDKGMMQYVFYTAGDDGFKVQGTNLPVHVSKVSETPEVTAARIAHQEAYVKARQDALRSHNGFSNIVYTPVATTASPLRNTMFNDYQVPRVTHRISSTLPMSFGSDVNLFSGKPLNTYKHNIRNFQTVLPVTQPSFPVNSPNVKYNELDKQVQQVQKHENKFLGNPNHRIDLLEYRKQIQPPVEFTTVAPTPTPTAFQNHFFGTGESVNLAHYRTQVRPSNFITLEVHRSDVLPENLHGHTHRVLEIRNRGFHGHNFVNQHEQQQNIENSRRQAVINAEEFRRQQTTAVAAARAFKALTGR